jgi:metallo-beta-lactamase class B
MKGRTTAAVIIGAAVAGFTQTKPVENTIAAHVAAAHAAANDTWLILFSELCGGAMGAGGRASSLPTPPSGAAARGRQAGPPPRERWYHDPVKVFDNLYVFPTEDVNAWAIQTSDGIIMIDATYERTGANRANPAGPNAFILNPTRVSNYLAVADHCGQAIALAQGQKK